MTEVLIIDDEIDISESISAILQDEGLKCTTVSNSIDAIDSINKVAYELIILDVWLNEEDYDGIKLLKLIKKDYPKIPVIIISGHGNIDMAVEAIKEGAYEFVEKPFKSERLILSVSRALEVKLMKEENKELKEIGFNKNVRRRAARRGAREAAAPSTHRIEAAGFTVASLLPSRRTTRMHSAAASGKSRVAASGAQLSAPDSLAPVVRLRRRAPHR